MDQTNTLNQVLTALVGIDSHACREVMSDYDYFINKIQHKIYVQSFIDQYRDAEVSYLKGNEAGEKKSLKIARDIMEYKSIRNEDLSDENLKDYITGSLLTSERIAKRQRELLRDGWK